MFGRNSLLSQHKYKTSIKTKVWTHCWKLYTELIVSANDFRLCTFKTYYEIPRRQSWDELAWNVY